MNMILLLSVLFPVLALVALLFVLRSLSGTTDRLGANEDSLGQREYSPAYYQPMRKLLDPEELLAAQSLPGVGVSEFRRFRRARLQAFRAYLSDMRSDFNRLEFKARYFLLSGLASDSHLVSELNQTKLKFQSRLVRVELELALFALGFGSVNVSALVEGIEAYHSALLPSTSRAGQSAF